MANLNLWWVEGAVLLAWIVIATVRGWVASARLEGMKEVADGMSHVN